MRTILAISLCAALSACHVTGSDNKLPEIPKERQVVIELDGRGCPVSAEPRVLSCASNNGQQRRKSYRGKQPQYLSSDICADNGQAITWEVNSNAKDAEFRIIFDKRDSRYPTDCDRASLWQKAGSPVLCTVNQTKTDAYYYKIELRTDRDECGLDPTIYINR